MVLCVYSVVLMVLYVYSGCEISVDGVVCVQ